MRGIFQDDRISERRITFHDQDDKEMVTRHMRCILTLVDVLDRMLLNPIWSPGFVKEYLNVRFAIVPKLATLEQVYGVDEEIEYQKVICDFAGITLFKIPSLVNNVEEYVTMLLNKHYDQKRSR